MSTFEPTLERLIREHRPLLHAFDCGVPELNEFLSRYALRHAEQDQISRTWLAMDRTTTPRIAGFFTLSNASVDRQSVDGVVSLSTLPRFPIPAVLLARLGVDRRVHGQGVGTWLFEEALDRTRRLREEGAVGFRILVTDAKNEDAMRFYIRRGMIPGPGETWPRRMVLDLKTARIYP